MKKNICAMAITGFLISCGGNSAGKVDTAAIEKGQTLVNNNDCITCHRPDELLTGPSYSEIAKKYAGLPDSIVTHLGNKIIHGGAGVWGEVPMVPHSGIAKEDAEAMAKYILSFKK